MSNLKREKPDFVDASFYWRVLKDGSTFFRTPFMSLAILVVQSDESSIAMKEFLEGNNWIPTGERIQHQSL